MSDINYRQQWAEGEIEAGTLLDAIDALARRRRELEAERNPFAIMHQRSKDERDTLRAEVERLRGLIDRIRQIVTHPHESKEALAARVRNILEAGACAHTTGDTPAA